MASTSRLTAAKTWNNVGLRDSHHIGEIRVHPQNPDVVYVAALGHAFGPNDERGVYRSTDGGETWECVLHVSDKAGAVDLTLDVTNPRIIYASIWQVYRNFWELASGGPDSGLWKSTDGGDSWTDISRNPGLPQEGILGKIGVSVSPSPAQPRLGNCRGGERKIRHLPVGEPRRELGASDQ